jgi:lysophospholipase L1-like esterase
MPPEKVAADFREFQRRLRATLPEARLIYVSLKPSPSRVKLLAAMVQTNALIAAECARDPLARFVDVFTLMLDAHGQPRAELFLPDRLHMNATGYALWAAQLDPVLASAP